MNTQSQPTDQQLKQALAKMLPDKISRHCPLCEPIVWIEFIDGHPRKLAMNEVKNTELLELCGMAEKTLSHNELYKYIDLLLIDATYRDVLFKSWQQRVQALAKVKGLEV